MTSAAPTTQPDSDEIAAEAIDRLELSVDPAARRGFFAVHDIIMLVYLGLMRGLLYMTAPEASVGRRLELSLVVSAVVPLVTPVVPVAPVVPVVSSPALLDVAVALSPVSPVPEVDPEALVDPTEVDAAVSSPELLDAPVPPGASAQALRVRATRAIHGSGDRVGRMDARYHPFTRQRYHERQTMHSTADCAFRIT